MEKGPRVQGDVISVAENLIEEIILQDKCHKSKYVDHNPQTSTSQIEQIQKPDLNQQNKEKTDLYILRGNCSMNMSSTRTCPPDVFIEQTTKQNLLVEEPTREGITSEDPINENPLIGKTSQDTYSSSKSIDSTLEELDLEIPTTSQNQQMSNQQKKRNNKKNQQQSTKKISKIDDIVFHDRNDLTTDENDPKNVGENDILSACECDDVVDNVENSDSRNDCGYETVQTLKSYATNQDNNIITDNDTEVRQHDVEQNIQGMMNPEQPASENADQGNMTLTGLQIVENQDFLAVHDTPKMIIEADALIEQTSQVNKYTTVQNSSKRLPLTEEQKIKFKNNVSKTVFVTDETNLVQRLFRTKPVQLFKDINAQAGGEVAQIVRINKGLRILTQNDEQKNKLLKLSHLCGNSVTVTLPYSLSKNSHENKSYNKEFEFKVKGVIYGIEEDDENLKELAEAIGAVQLKRIGNPETSKTTLVTFAQGMDLPPFIHAFGRKFKVHEFVPKPMRCDRCQQFGHIKLHCSRPEICSRCGENRSYELCPHRHTSRSE